jgi:spore germination protein KA
MLGHMCKLKSFGQEYMKPFSPIVWKGLKDSFIRLPLQMKKGGQK